MAQQASTNEWVRGKTSIPKATSSAFAILSASVTSATQPLRFVTLQMFENFF
jgi:hypothetical protein